MHLFNQRNAIFAAFAVLTVMAQSADAKVAIDSVEVGLSGISRPGLWTSVRVTASGSDAANSVFEVVTPDPSNSPVIFPGGRLSANSDGTASGTAYFKAGRLETTVTVRVLEAESKQLLASRRFSTVAQTHQPPQLTILRHDQPVWLIVGEMPAFQSESHDVTQIQRASGVELPSNWRDYSVCDVVFLAGQFDLTDVQSDALRNWVSNGGHLIAAIGTRSEQLAKSPLADWLLRDRTLTEREISDLSGFEILSESEYRILFTRKPRGTSIEQSDGQTLIAGVDGSLLTRSAVGFGRVTLLGVDLDKAPLSRWRGLSPLLSAIAELKPVEVATDQRRGRISETGVTDLGTQIQTGLENFPEIGTRSTLTVLELVLLYLLIIGPADYLLVHRLLKRPGLTWVTFPATVLIVGFLASSSAGSANGDATLVNQLDILDIDATSGHTRQSVWASIYSPANQRYRLEVKHDIRALSGENAAVVPDSDVWTSWSGVPESNFGGMYRSGGLEVGRPQYTIDLARHEISNLPISVWSDRIVLSETSGVTSTDLVTSDLRRASTGQLTLDSSLTHHFAGPLDDWLIVYGNRVYFHRFASGSGIADSGIKPGVAWHPGDNRVGTQELRSYLTGLSFRQLEKKKGSGGSDYATRRVDWESSSNDLFSVSRMISLHELAGGATYTGLANKQLKHLELSTSLPLNRAILIARTNQPTAAVHLNGEAVSASRRDTFVRLLLPVVEVALTGALPDFDPQKNKQPEQ